MFQENRIVRPIDGAWCRPVSGPSIGHYTAASHQYSFTFVSAYHATSRAEARKFFVGGNWKCNGSVQQAKELVSILNQSSLTVNTEVVVCPSQIHIQGVKEAIRSDVAVGAQDVWTQGNGAFTGETSADMLADMGVKWVLVGHSERRGKGESNAEVAAKAKYALDKGLSVIACCGEPLENRNAGTTNDFVFPQIKAYADAFTKNDWSRVVIAYEPIWAIGTGLTATPEQAQETHAAIRQYLGQVAGADVAENTRILYGGSANAKVRFKYLSKQMAWSYVLSYFI